MIIYVVIGSSYDDEDVTTLMVTSDMDIVRKTYLENKYDYDIIWTEVWKNNKRIL